MITKEKDLPYFEAISRANFRAKGKTNKIEGNATAQTTNHAWIQVAIHCSTMPRLINEIAPDMIKLTIPESKKAYTS